MDQQKPQSLQTRTLLYNVTIVGAAVACLTGLFVFEQHTAIERQLQLRAEALAEFLASQAQFALLVGDRAELERIAASTLGNEDVLDVRFSDAGGVVLAQGCPSPDGPRMRHSGNRAGGFAEGRGSRERGIGSGHGRTPPRCIRLCSHRLFQGKAGGAVCAYGSLRPGRDDASSSPHPGGTVYAIPHGFWRRSRISSNSRAKSARATCRRRPRSNTWTRSAI